MDISHGKVIFSFLLFLFGGELARGQGMSNDCGIVHEGPLKLDV